MPIKLTGQQLEKEGLSLQVVDPRIRLPYDEGAVLASARKAVDSARRHSAYKAIWQLGEFVVQ